MSLFEVNVTLKFFRVVIKLSNENLLLLLVNEINDLNVSLVQMHLD